MEGLTDTIRLPHDDWVVISLKVARDVGMQLMCTAVISDHDAGQYALSMMLLFQSDDEKAKYNGIKLFCALEAFGALTICKVRLEQLI
ncbi:hypothetical protein AHAS_Ahas14G0158700 [Arachis hypogaea]